jgi:hypothetical protein
MCNRSKSVERSIGFATKSTAPAPRACQQACSVGSSVIVAIGSLTAYRSWWSRWDNSMPPMPGIISRSPPSVFSSPCRSSGGRSMGVTGRRRWTRSSRSTGCGSESRRAPGRGTRAGSGRRRGGRRCGCWTWGSRWCCGTSGWGCTTRSCPCRSGRVILLERLRWETRLLWLLREVSGQIDPSADRKIWLIARYRASPCTHLTNPRRLIRDSGVVIPASSFRISVQPCRSAISRFVHLPRRISHA